MRASAPTRPAQATSNVPSGRPAPHGRELVLGGRSLVPHGPCAGQGVGFVEDGVGQTPALGAVLPPPPPTSRRVPAGRRGAGAGGRSLPSGLLASAASPDRPCRETRLDPSAAHGVPVPPGSLSRRARPASGERGCGDLLSRTQPVRPASVTARLSARALLSSGPRAHLLWAGLGARRQGSLDGVGGLPLGP